MEDRCVICGEIVPEGTMVCKICKIANDDPPCRVCFERSETCHIYCRKYKEYYDARTRARDIKRARNDEESYFIKKAKRKNHFGFRKRDQYKEN